MSTIKDAFIAEVLGDLDKLDKAINELPAKLEQSALAISTSAEALDKAGQGFKDHIDAYMRGQQESLANNINLLAQNSIRSTVDIQSQIIHKAMALALDQYEKNRVDDSREKVMLCLVSVLMTMFGVLVAAAMVYRWVWH